MPTRDAATAARPARPPALSTHSVHALRALGALLVVLMHLTGATGFEGKVFADAGGAPALDRVHTAASGIGVDVFFALSGFFMLLSAAGPRLGRSPVRRTLWRRLVRILPMYWLVTTGVLAIHLTMPGAVNGSQEHPPDVLASYLLLPQAGLPLLLVGWTLTHIVVFYGVFCLGLLTRSTRGLWAVLGAWGALVVAVRLLAGGSENLYVAFLGNLFNLQFLLGAAVAQALLAGWRRAAVPALVVGTVAVVALAVARLLPLPGSDTDAYRVFGITTAVCVLLYGLVAGEQSRGWRTPGRLMSVAGSSYSLYLVHVPLIGAMSVVGARLPLPGAWPVRVAAVAAALVACVVAGRLAHRWVERPIAAAFEGTSWSLPSDWLAGFRRPARPLVPAASAPDLLPGPRGTARPDEPVAP